jgi:16S rRNA (adenine1518-N6/adenine1519-N6)-dimethyltransferase
VKDLDQKNRWEKMTSPKNLLKAWEIRPRKSMGQNFLSDPNMAAAIVSRSDITKKDLVVEIGSGLGAITLPLSEKAKHVFAVEPDPKISKLLRNELLAAGTSNVTIVQEDILKCDFLSMTGHPAARLKVVGNLPYHLSSPILVHIAENRHVIENALLMFQKELADRLLAVPGTKNYGRLSVLMSYCGKVRKAIEVPHTSFYPIPKVDSTVLHIHFYHPPSIQSKDERFLFRVIRAAFGKRRKMLKNALQSSDLSLDSLSLKRAFERTSIVSSRRAETLSIEEFVRLSDCLKTLQKP